MQTAMSTKIFRACHIFVEDAAATFDREQVNELLSFARHAAGRGWITDRDSTVKGAGA
jgi:hypothetical protein